MRERLIEIIKKVPYGVSVGAKFEQHFCEKIADCLLENNVIVLPCKVGTKIYHIDLEIPEDELRCSDCIKNHSGFGEFYCDDDYLGWPSMEDKLNNDNDVCPRFKPYICEEKFDLHFWASYEKWFGITWFLTKEQAEKALAEREGK